MPDIEALDACSPNLDAVLALNNRHAAALSLLSAESFRVLLGQAFHATRIGTADAFLIGLDEGADYASPNFRWFRTRFSRFAYVDRVAVAEHARGRGLARRLYEDFFSAAAKAGHDLVTCEVNSDPPNPASDAFHAALGFEVVGEAAIYEGERTVRYMTRRLEHPR